MIQNIYKNIVDGQDVRKNLIELRKQIKDPVAKRVLFYELDGEYECLYQLLEDEDAKIRKNVALIMGELGIQTFLDKLYESYQKEEKLFVKADYLTAISYLNYTSLQQQLKERLYTLTTMPVEENNRKHINEEIRVLSSMCIKLEQPKIHAFTGYDETSDVILLTNRDHKEVTCEQIKLGQAKVFNAGVIARTNNLREILAIRTYSELLFKLPKVAQLELDPQEAAHTLYAGGIVEFMNARHEGWAPYYFRIEMKTRMPLDKKSVFAKKMASELERLSNRELINSTSNYEFEIRLIENKEGYFNVLLKLYTLKDKRFDYRKNTIAASIAPETAALVVELTKDYMKPDAQVLDPFCGVGTMLIEREQKIDSQVMYGIDMYGEAIDGAIENANCADTDIYFINRDFFGFTHKYFFDEIITNMPAQGGRKSEVDMEQMYDRFFKKSLEILADEAILIMYTRDQQYIKRAVNKYSAYHIAEVFEISKKEEAYVYVIAVSQ